MPRSTSKSAKRELNGDSVVHENGASRPQKKAKLLDNTDDEDSEAEAGDAGFQVNEEYARRFEHNKKRAEQHRRRQSMHLGAAHMLTVCSGGKIRQGQGFPGRR
jgi:protein KRI1